MFQDLIHTLPNFGEISSNIYEDIVFACGDLDLLFFSNQDIYEYKYICDKNWVKLP